MNSIKGIGSQIYVIETTCFQVRFKYCSLYVAFLSSHREVHYKLDGNK